MTNYPARKALSEKILQHFFALLKDLKRRGLFGKHIKDRDFLPSLQWCLTEMNKALSQKSDETAEGRKEPECSTTANTGTTSTVPSEGGSKPNHGSIVSSPNTTRQRVKRKKSPVTICLDSDSDEETAVSSTTQVGERLVENTLSSQDQPFPDYLQAQAPDQGPLLPGTQLDSQTSGTVLSPPVCGSSISYRDSERSNTEVTSFSSVITRQKPLCCYHLVQYCVWAFCPTCQAHASEQGVCLQTPYVSIRKIPGPIQACLQPQLLGFKGTQLC